MTTVPKDFNPAIVPQPKGTYRWYTGEEFMRLVPTHGIFLLRGRGIVQTGWPVLKWDHHLFHGSTFDVDATFFTEYEKSTDGGLTWEPVGVRVEESQ
jgi:hypothetical protein